MLPLWLRQSAIVALQVNRTRQTTFKSVAKFQLRYLHMSQKLVEEPLESYVIKDGIKVIERFFSVPLDYSKPEGEKITIFARNLIPLREASTPEKEANLPYMLFLQGGPGFEVEMGRIRTPMKQIHEQGYQTLWLDQRGTGLSTPISPDMLGNKSDQEIADYLKHFRADNIVRDCEFIRKELLSHKPNPADQKWSILGQSFGGFCALTYLSFFPDALREAFLTGGLAPLVDHPDPVYEKTIARISKRNTIYYKKYPQDIKRVRTILAYLEANNIRLPDGGTLTPNRWLQLGMAFGMRGGIDEVHQLVFRASNELQRYGRLSYKLLQSVQNESTFDGNPLYAILHEACYCQSRASNWSASRIISQYDKFQWDSIKHEPETTPVFFSGEMIFPDMFDDYANLRPLKGAANLLAQFDGWGKLYDDEQLKKNEVKVTCATYIDDMYVDFDLAQQTASKVKGTEQFITNQMFHDGLRVDSKEVFEKLFQISKREYD